VKGDTSLNWKTRPSKDRNEAYTAVSGGRRRVLPSGCSIASHRKKEGKGRR